MTRLLVVHSDPTVADARAATLRQVGYAVETCAGPGDLRCPVLDDQPCPLLDRADVLLYDAHLGSPREMEFLVAHLRDTYVDLPLILVGADGPPDWIALDGQQRVWPVPAAASPEQVSDVIEEALGEQGMAV
jgi:hypothetical protein